MTIPKDVTALVAALREYEEMDAFRDRKTFGEGASALESLAAEIVSLKGHAEAMARLIFALEGGRVIVSDGGEFDALTNYRRDHPA
jgi:hypothetical protein